MSNGHCGRTMLSVCIGVRRWFQFLADARSAPVHPGMAPTPRYCARPSGYLDQRNQTDSYGNRRCTPMRFCVPVPAFFVRRRSLSISEGANHGGEFRRHIDRLFKFFDFRQWLGLIFQARIAVGGAPDGKAAHGLGLTGELRINRRKPRGRDRPDRDCSGTVRRQARARP